MNWSVVEMRLFVEILAMRELVVCVSVDMRNCGACVQGCCGCI
jgi:hypothetical protein